MPPKKKTLAMESLLEKGLIARGSDELFKYGRIPTGIPVLDGMLGGGIPQKRMTILNGNPNVGKSYLASQIVANYQRNNAPDTAAWIDLEMSWDPVWMAKCGIDVDNIIVSQPTTGEDAFDVLQVLMDNNFGIIILDSIAGIIPANVAEEGFDYTPMAWQGRFINAAIARIMSHLKHGCGLICINQLRSGIGPYVSDVMPGGLAQTFFSHMTLNVRRNGWIEEEKKRVGFELEVNMRKTKVGSDNQAKCSIPFRFDGGIDLVETYIREAINVGFLIQSGAWYNIPNVEKPIMGMNNLRTYYQENPESFEALKIGVE